MASCQSIRRKKHERNAFEEVQTDVQTLPPLENYERKAFSAHFTFSQYCSHLDYQTQIRIHVPYAVFSIYFYLFLYVRRV